jgi:hypothetical protein
LSTQRTNPDWQEKSNPALKETNSRSNKEHSHLLLWPSILKLEKKKQWLKDQTDSIVTD